MAVTRVLFAALLMVIAAVPGALLLNEAIAQNQPQAQVTSVSAAGWPKVEAAMTVLDASGRPVTGLAAGAFSATIDGTTAPVTGVTTASAPGMGIAVVLTFDVSGSMAGAPLEQSKAAAKGLVQQMGPDDQAAVVAFSSGVNVVQGFTGDRAALERAIDSLAAVGDTALYAGVRDSVKLADTAPLPRQAIVLLSDGVDHGGVSGVDAQTTLTLVEQNDAIVFAIGLGSIVDENYLSALAARGRGTYLKAPAPDQLKDVYDYAGSVLRNQYILTLDASAVNTTTASAHTLVVNVSTGGATISASAAVQPPAPATSAPTEGAAPSPAVTAPALSADSESSGGFPIAVAGAIFVAAAAVGATAIVLLSRRRRAREAVAPQFDVSRLRQPEAPSLLPKIQRAVEDEKALAYLTLPGGEKRPLGTAPVTVGFTADCDVQLPGGQPGSLERARVWWRDGSYMLHNLSRAETLRIGGRTVTWAVLEDGDEIEVGHSSVVFTEAEEGGPVPH